VVGAKPGGLGDGSPAVESRRKAPVWSLGDEVPETEAKCEISVQFFYLFYV